jgi:hypothetical protein
MAQMGESGSLLKCDTATAGIIRMLNGFPEGLGGFIIKELDDVTMLVQPSKVSGG